MAGGREFCAPIRQRQGNRWDNADATSRSVRYHLTPSLPKVLLAEVEGVMAARRTGTNPTQDVSLLTGSVRSPIPSPARLAHSLRAPTGVLPWPSARPGSGKGVAIVNGVRHKLFDLEGLCWDAIYAPDALTFTEPLAALVGQAAVRRLEQEVRTAITLTGGRKSQAHGDDQDTETVLMVRLLEDPDWAEYLVNAYRTLIREGLDTVGVDVRDTGDEWLPPSTS